MNTIRTFIGIPIAESVRNYLQHFSKQMINPGDKINWVAPENIHITIGFLGETDPKAIAAQAEQLEEIFEQYPSSSLELTDTGVFPHANSPRVLWIGASPLDNHLIELVGSAKDHLHSLGYELDKRKFQPHITLGRVKSISRNSQFIHEFLSAEVRDMQFPVHEVVWYESTLTQAGAVYKNLKTFNLKSGGQG